MKTAILVDGANNHGAIKSLGYVIDYREVLKYFKKGGEVLAWYYTALLTEPDGSNNLQELIDWLSYNGYTVVSKASKMFTDPLSGLTRIKGNMDIEIAVHAMQLSEYVDNIILFTGDGDFVSLITALRMRGVGVTVVSTRTFCSDDLRRAADKYIDLMDLKPLIERKYNARPTANGR